MLSVRFAGPFKKDRRLMRKRRMNIDRLDGIMELIVNEQPLPEHCHPHPLRGTWTGKWECHIDSDWLLIYKIRPEARSVTFHRTGTHSDLFE